MKKSCAQFNHNYTSQSWKEMHQLGENQRKSGSWITKLGSMSSSKSKERLKRTTFVRSTRMQNLYSSRSKNNTRTRKNKFACKNEYFLIA